MLGAAPNSATFANGAQVGIGYSYEFTGTGSAADGAFFLETHSFATGGTQNSDSGVSGALTDEILLLRLIALIFFDTNTVFQAGDNALVGYGPVVNDFSDQNDILAFRKNGTGNVFGVADNGGAETTRDTGSSSTGTPLIVGIRVLAASTAQFLLNGALLGADVTTNVHTGNLTHIAGLTNISAASDRSMDIGGMFAWSET